MIRRDYWYTSPNTRSYYWLLRVCRDKDPRFRISTSGQHHSGSRIHCPQKVCVRVSQFTPNHMMWWESRHTQIPLHDYMIDRVLGKGSNAINIYVRILVKTSVCNLYSMKYCILVIVKDTCHDSGDSRGDSPLEELEGVVSNLLGSGPFLAFSSRGNHAWLEEDPFEQDIVFSKVEEHFSPNLLSHFKSPLNSMLTIKQDLWFHNWGQSTFLQFQSPKTVSMSIKLALNSHTWVFKCVYISALLTWEMAA